MGLTKERYRVRYEGQKLQLEMELDAFTAHDALRRCSELWWIPLAAVIEHGSAVRLRDLESVRGGKRGQPK